MAQFLEQLDDDLAVLFARLTDGSLAAADRARLAARLDADPVAQELYLDFIDLHAMLAWEKGVPVSQMPAEVRWSQGSGVRSQESSRHTPCAATEAEKTSVVSGQLSVAERAASSSQLSTINYQLTSTSIPHSAIRIPQSLRSRPLAFSLFVSTVATVVFLMLAAQIHVGSGANNASNTVTPPLPFVAQLTAEKDCRWGERSEVVFEGAHLRTGQILDLEQGLAEVAFRDGARTVIEGPAVFVVDGKNSGRLDLGKLVARAESQSAAGFTIRTPTAAVVDLGTEFGVSVARDGELGVIVMKGSVRVEPRGAGPKETSSFDPAILAAGQSLTIRPSETTPPRIERDALSADQFVRAIPRPVGEREPRRAGVEWDGTVSPVQAGFEQSFTGEPYSESFWKFNSPEGFATQDIPYGNLGRMYQLPQSAVQRELNNEAGWFVEFRVRLIDATHLSANGFYFNVGAMLDDGKGLLQIGILPSKESVEVVFNSPQAMLSRSKVLHADGFHVFRVTRRAGNESSFEVQIDGDEPFVVDAAPTVANGLTSFGHFSFGDITSNIGVGRAIWDYVRVNYEPGTGTERGSEVHSLEH